MFGKYFRIIVAGLLLCFLFDSSLKAQNDITTYSEGISQYYAGNDADALANFQAYQKKVPDDPRPYFYEGLCLLHLGKKDQANTAFLKGAAREYTPKGRQINIDGVLTRIQGSERMMIEAARKTVDIAWKQREQKRQELKFGETLDQQKELISQENRNLKGDSKLLVEPQTRATADKSKLPSVDPIIPYTSEERDVVKIPDPYDKSKTDFQFFRDDLGKVVLSTAERKRLEEREKKITYSNPMERPSADGTKFINIYDPAEAVSDKKTYVSQDDPDDLYANAETGPLAVASLYLNIFNQNTQNSRGQEGIGTWNVDNSSNSMIGPGPDMMGPDMKGSGMSGERTSQYKNPKNDTNTIFGSKASANPYKDAVSDKDLLNLFKDAKDFTPTVLQPARNNGMSGMSGMSDPGMSGMSDPGMSMSPAPSGSPSPTP